MRAPAETLMATPATSSILPVLARAAAASRPSRASGERG